MPRHFRRFVLLAAGVLCMAGGAASARAAQPAGPLKVHPQNPRYFADPAGKAVYLTGSHTWQSLQDGVLPKYTVVAQPFDYPAYLALLQANHHNFIRLWRWEMMTHDPQPWLRTGPGDAHDGKPKVDLTRFNPAYFERLRTRVVAAGERGIYVSIMLFEDWIFMAKRGDYPLTQHPFHKDNNINGIDGDPNGDRYGFEIHTMEAPPQVLEVQKAYIRKVIETVGDLDNVLYEISNEANRRTRDWQYEMVRFIKSVEAGRPKQHPVGMTSVGDMNPDVLASPADWTSLSTTKFNKAADVWASSPPAADGKKVDLLDTDHIGWSIFINDADLTRAWVWKAFTRGHSTLLMENLSDSPGWVAGRAAMGQTRRYAERMNLAAMTPQDRLASSGYCLAHAAKESPEYLAYLPEGGTVTLDLSGAAGDLAVEWFDPVADKAVSGGRVTAGSSRDLVAPFKGPAVVYLVGAK